LTSNDNFAGTAVGLVASVCLALIPLTDVEQISGQQI